VLKRDVKLQPTNLAKDKTLYNYTVHKPERLKKIVALHSTEMAAKINGTYYYILHES